MILKLDWEKRAVEIRVEGEDQLVQKQMPFANPECDAVKYLLLYNHTGHALSCGCESCRVWCLFFGTYKNIPVMITGCLSKVLLVLGSCRLKVSLPAAR